MPMISMDSVQQNAGMITLIKFLFILDDNSFCPFSHIPSLNIDVQYCRFRGVFNCKIEDVQHSAPCIFIVFVFILHILDIAIL